jgi:hypothetical protein
MNRITRAGLVIAGALLVRLLDAEVISREGVTK